MPSEQVSYYWQGCRRSSSRVRVTGVAYLAVNLERPRYKVLLGYDYENRLNHNGIPEFGDIFLLHKQNNPGQAYR